MDNVYSSKIEEKINKRWARSNISKKLEEKNKAKPKFYFLDGPPYVTNEIHEGTLLNIFLKDSVIRYKYMTGYNVRAQPGWDTHGLPIEVAAEKELGIKNKHDIANYGEENFINYCRKFADRYIKINTDVLLNYGLFWFRNKPYKTYDNYYIENIWNAIKKADEQGLLYHGSKTTWFCVRCGAPMSNYEVKDKYKPKEDPSIYVLFKLIDGRYILVWTTTPWTLPSNVAIAVNASADYVEIEIEGKKIILAESRLDIINQINKEYKIVRKFKGTELLGLKYEHPFSDLPQIKANADKICIIVNGEEILNAENEPFVNISEGSGFVHVAPGHGISDYKVAMKYNLPVLSPVNEDGTYKEEAGFLKGKHIFEVNDMIIGLLENKGLIFSKGKIVHDYPHCWRCSTPLVQIATTQWFINVTKIKNQLIEIAKDINWTPEISKQNFMSWLSNIEDWVISRQRYWNTPLPVWVCDKCGNKITIGSKQELIKLSNVKDIKDLHKTALSKVTIKCPICGGEMHRVNDVIDVWIDSGAASFASLDYIHNKSEFERLFPVDFICEANEQIRGWFYSLLVLGYIFSGKLPYLNGLMHKFVIGEDRKKLSKSSGNYKPVSELLKEGYSRDAVRISLLKHNIEEEAPFSIKNVQDSMKTLNIIFNLTNLLGMIKDKNPSKFDAPYKVEDAWIISRWNNTKKSIREEMDKFRVDTSLNYLINFIENDLSRIYVKLAKPRIFDEDDQAAILVFREVMDQVIKYSAIFMPFISEYAYLSYKRKGSVILEDLPDTEEAKINNELEERMENTMKITQDIMAFRDSSKIPVKRPIKNLIILGKKPENIIDSIVQNITNVMQISFNTDDLNVSFDVDMIKLKDRFSSDEISKIAGKFIELTPQTIIRNIGNLNLEIDGKVYNIKAEEIKIKVNNPDIEAIKGSASNTILLVDKTIDKEVENLWIKREIIRAIQDIRKQSNMQRNDKIGLEFTIDNKENGDFDEQTLNNIYVKTNSQPKKGKLLKIQTLNINGKNIVLSIYSE